MKKNIQDSTKIIGAIKKAVNIGAMYAGLKKGWDVVKGISNDYIDMVETNNLFEVSMGKVVDQYGNLDEAQSQYYIKAMDFQNEMNEKLATNRQELQKYQAMYFSMLKSQGISLDKSYLMSESLTKAGYDIASLYNLEVEDAMSKLKSGLAGQVEPLRKIGVDISESSLQKVLNDVGIERSVQKLSYAEKEVARYIAIMQQAGQAQGDFAKTFESPANQVRVFKNQLIELRQVAGAFIVNTFGNILTYANAIIMVVKEILKAFASLFGYDLDVSASTGLVEVSDTVGDIGSGLGSATKKAKEFKKQLMGFDEINNIEPPTQSSGGSGGGGATGGIDSKLLDNLKEWDNKMKSISGKAQEIRDKMLEWLGFHRNDKGGWELNEGLTNFEKILEVVKAIGLAILTWKVSSAITNLLKNLGILNSTRAFQIAFGLTLAITGIYLLYNGIKHLLEGNVDIFTILETALGGAMTAFGIASILKGVVKTMSLGSALKIGFGLTLALTGIFLEYNSVKKMLEGDISLGTILQSTGSAFLIGLGTWLLTGSVTAGLIGTAGVLAFNIGIEIGTAIMNFIEGTDEVDVQASKLTEDIKKLNSELDNNRQAYESTIKSINKTCEAQIVEADYAGKLTQQLKYLVDANGRVKAGNEERVDLILGELSKSLGIEIKRNQDLIIKNGEVIKSYQDLQQDIMKTIEAKKKEAEQTAIVEKYKESVKEQIQAERDFQKAKEMSAKAEAEYDELMSKDYGWWTKTHNEDCKQILQNMSDTSDKLAETRKAYEEATNDVSYYSKEMTEKITNDSKDAKKEIVANVDSITNTTVEKSQKTSNTLTDMVKNNYEKWEEQYNKLDTTAQSAMLSQVTTVDTWSPKLQQKWLELSQKDSRAYAEGLSKLDGTTRDNIQSAINTINSKSGEMYNAGYNDGDSARRGANDGQNSNGGSTQIGKWFVEGLLNAITSGRYTLWKAGWDLVNSALQGGNERQRTGSPAKETIKMGNFFTEGYIVGIKKKQEEVKRTSGELAETALTEFNKINSKGIKINTKDFKVDTNQYIDYGSINGQIQSQSKIALANNLFGEIVQAVKTGMSESEVNVNVEAKTEEGIIFKKVQTQANDYYMQTGISPFPAY